MKKTDPAVDEAVQRLNMRDGPTRRRLLAGTGLVSATAAASALLAACGSSTGSVPSQIATDAAVWLKAFRHSYSNGVGLIAAWAADEDLLGNTALVASTLATEQRLGHLRGPFESGAKFVSDLQKFLRKLGYVR